MLRRAVDRWLAVHHHLTGVPEGAVFILAHMRSGSSLLLHLLGSHPDLIAAGERNTIYRNSRDLDRLAIDCFRHDRRLFGRVRFTVDQLNHDHLLPDPQLILHHAITPVILVRRPETTIGSLSRTFAATNEWPLERCVDYYERRVQTLAAYAELLRGVRRDPIRIDYEALVRDPVASLEALRRELRLSTPFSDRYEVRRFTGRRGDPGPNIQRGRVLPDAGRPATLSAGVLHRLRAAYGQL